MNPAQEAILSEILVYWAWHVLRSHNPMRHTHHNCSLIPAAIAGILLLIPAMVAQVHERACNGDLRGPADLSLHISLKNGQNSFRQGELITLTAEYSASGQQRYLINNRSYDRSGRLDGYEIWCIEPQNGTDPLEDYHDSQFGLSGGGLFNEDNLGAKPFVIDLELNEWESLPPGSYRLSIIGTRVKDATKEGERHSIDTGIPLPSNTVEFTVGKADAEWQADQLRQAVRTLDSPDSGKEAMTHAARVLRFLGSEGAARELARHYWSEEQTVGWDLMLGLWGSPHRSIVLNALRAAIDDPDHPVTQYFVDTLVTLEAQSEPTKRFPQVGTMSTKDFSRAMDANLNEHQRRAKEYMAQVGKALGAKRGMAATLTASELLQAKTEDTREGRARLRHALIAGWETLPTEKRNEIIANAWDRVAGPEWLPVLENIVAAGPGRTAALRRMIEMFPDRGREAAIAEMIAPSGKILIEALALLPDKELPQIEQPLIARMEKGDNETIDYELLDRYASVRLLPRVKKVYEAQRDSWDCTTQAAMLRYLLRTDPDYGVAQIAHSVQKHSTGCYNTPLDRLKEYVSMPGVERIATATLDSPWTIAVRDAAESLMHYGSPSAEAALFARLERFHRRWMERPKELEDVPTGALAEGDERGLDEVLVKAISSAQAWFANADTLHRLKKLSSPAMQRDLDEDLDQLRTNSFRGIVSWIPDGKLRFNMGWYNGEGMANFKAKLAQFPPGSHVGLTVAEESHRAACDEMADTAKAVGVVLWSDCK
jgi:hypothetical protein